MYRRITGFAIAGLLLSPIGYADATDATITVVDESGTPTDVTSGLPDSRSDARGESTTFAAETDDGVNATRSFVSQLVSEQEHDARSDARSPDNHQP